MTYDEWKTDLPQETEEDWLASWEHQTDLAVADAVANEREACAELCDAEVLFWERNTGEGAPVAAAAARQIANNIRSRSRTL